MSFDSAVTPSSVLPASANGETRWYAAYTCSRHEKQVASQLVGRGVEHYLPLYETVQRWKDRRARVQLPLFPGYVFVHIALRDRLQVLQVPGVVNLVGPRRGVTPLRDEEVEVIRKGIEGRVRIAPHPYLKVGRRVRVRSGPLAGTEGILVRKRGCCRVVISLDLISRSMAAEIEECDLEAISDRALANEVARSRLQAGFRS